MAADPRKRQKKLQRRAGKRQDKKRAITKSQNVGLAEKLAKAAQFPVRHCFVNEALWSQGMGNLLFSRQFPDGRVAFGLFLIDRWCLGVKDVVIGILDEAEYETKIVRGKPDRFRDVDLTPATARAFVESAVAYAVDLGFPPQADYLKAKALFGNIDAAEATQTLELGREGKPYFFAGPNDGPERCRRIMAILTHRCGAGNFNYTMRVTHDEYQDIFGEAATFEPSDDVDDGDNDETDTAEDPVILLDENEVRRLPKQ
jgi:hypothetical protein